MTSWLIETCEILVLVLIHSLWQSPIVVGLVQLTLRSLNARFADTRYVVAVAGLFSIVLCTFVTGALLQLNPERIGSRHSVSSNAGASLQADFGKANEHPYETVDTAISNQGRTVAQTSPQDHNTAELVQDRSARNQARHPWSFKQPWLFPVLSLVWLCGAGLMLARSLSGYVTAYSWINDSALIDAVSIGELETIVADISRRLNLKYLARIIVSDRLVGPSVVGVVWPVILVPAAMVTGLSVEQWRIVLAHELAHVRRYDPIVNVVQVVIESLLFFNPAVWWLSHQIRREREACCDRLAVRICGEPLRIAKALIDVASTMVTKQTPYNSLAFEGESSESELSDRVTRLVNPNRPPISRVTGMFLCVSLLSLVVVGTMLYRGTHLAVQAAADWLSPRDRVERLAHLEAERNGNFVWRRPANTVKSNGDSSQNAADAGSPTDDGKIEVEVIVRTDDGSPLGPRFYLYSTSINGNHVSSGTLDSAPNSPEEHRKVYRFPPSLIRIAAMAPGWAVTASPKISLFSGAERQTVELVLTRGVALNVAITTETGTPIPTPWVSCNATVKIDRSGGSLNDQQQTGDPAGHVQFDHIAKGTYSFHVKAAGYQHRSVEQTFESLDTESAPLVIQLKPAKPSLVRIVNGETNEPVPNAKVVLSEMKWPGHTYFYSVSRRSPPPAGWQDFGTSDANGDVKLDQLDDGFSYDFLVMADGFGPAPFDGKADQPVHTVKLFPPLRISGRVTGSLERLQRPYKKTGYQFSAHAQFDSKSGEYFNVDVDEDGRFVIDQIGRGEKVTLSLPGQSPGWTVDQSISNVELTIQSEAAAHANVPRREVIIRLTGTSPEAPAEGTLFVSWNHPLVPPSESEVGPLPINQNEVRLKLPVGAQLHLRAENLPGYRIAEQSQILIADGPDPQIIPAPVTIVGGIYGTVTRSDGTPATQAATYLVAAKLPPGESDHTNINPSGVKLTADYLRQIPLGGRYRVFTYECQSSGCVWTISREVVIDEKHPIEQVDLKLPAGKPLSLDIIDEQNNPVGGQPVDLELSFQQKSLLGKWSKSNFGVSFRLPFVSTNQGKVELGNFSFDQSIDPMEVRLTCIAKPVQFAGATMLVDATTTNRLSLKKGIGVSGILIDEATNRPIPNADIRLYPKNYHIATFKEQITTKTDGTGQFRFDGLEPIEYRFNVDSASPKGVVVTPNGTNGVQINYPNGPVEMTLDARRPTGQPLRYEIVIHPNGNLKALE